MNEYAPTDTRHARWSGRRCPKCRAELLTDDINDWCSFITCDYGIAEDVAAPPGPADEGEGR